VPRLLTSQIVIDKFASIIDSQDEKGIKKYGISIDEASNLQYNWELMALEETADLQKYLVKQIMRLKSENRFKSKWINELQVNNDELLHRIKLLEEDSIEEWKKPEYMDLDD
jgi:ketol-acid reductoisomerase